MKEPRGCSGCSALMILAFAAIVGLGAWVGSFRKSQSEVRSTPPPQSDAEWRAEEKALRSRLLKCVDAGIYRSIDTKKLPPSLISGHRFTDASFEAKQDGAAAASRLAGGRGNWMALDIIDGKTGKKIGAYEPGRGLRLN